MKTRNGFVSNSSSSSFIIALKKTSTPCPHCGRKDPDFLDMVEKSENYVDDNRVNGRSSASEKLEALELGERTRSEEYLWMSKEERENLKASINKYLDNEDWIIAEITLSNHDNNLREILNNMVSSGNAEILYQTD